MICPDREKRVSVVGCICLEANRARCRKVGEKNPDLSRAISAPEPLQILRVQWDRAVVFGQTMRGKELGLLCQGVEVRSDWGNVPDSSRAVGGGCQHFPEELPEKPVRPAPV